MKKILALLLAAAMCLMLLAACGSSAADTDTAAEEETAAEETAEETTEEETDAEAEEAEAEEEDEEGDEEEIVNIRFCFLDIMGMGENCENMAAALNEITEKEIGVHVDFEPFNVGEYSTQVSMMLTGGESIDLMSCTLIPGTDVATMYASGQLMDITDLLSEYAPDVMDLVGGYLGAYTYDGRIYGVPTYRNYALNNYIAMNADILDELGIREDAENMSSWEEYEAILQAVADKYAGTGLYPLVGGTNQVVMYAECWMTPLSGDFSNGYFYDNVGSFQGVVIVDGKAVALNDLPEYEQNCAKLAEWYDKGYIYPDAATNTQDQPQTLIGSGVGFSMYSCSEYGVESTIGAQTGTGIVAVKFADDIVSSATITAWGAGVPVTASEPEAAVKFLNLAYSNAEVANLLRYGVEGDDYQLVDGVIADPEDGTVEWRALDGLFGNAFLCYPDTGKESDYRAICLEMTEEAPKSEYLGFALDTSELANEIAAITSARDQYAADMNCGHYTESLYADYCSAMQSAGIDDYVAQVQTQLDIWLNE